MKYIAACIFVFMLSVGVVSAAVPMDSFTVSHADAKPGEKVDLTTLIYNAEKTQITYTIVLATPEKTIATAKLVVPASGAKKSVEQFVVPAVQTKITATIKSALDKKGTHVAVLEKEIASVVVGPAPESAKASFLDSVKQVAIVAKVYTAAEAFRSEKLEYFTAIRDGAKLRVGNTVEDATKGIIKSNITSATNILSGDNREEVQPIETKDDTADLTSKGSLIDYATFIFSAMLVQLFASQTMFYVVSALLLLVIVRAIFRRVF